MEAESAVVKFQSLASGKYIVEKYDAIDIIKDNRTAHIITALYNGTS
jgi:hypothetical protein